MVMQGSEGGGGGVAVVVCGGAVNNALRSRYPRSGGGGGRSVEENLDSPIMFFMFFHKAIRSELDELHLSALAFATGKLADIQSLVERYRFVRSIYKHHCNAEDEVIFPALDIRVKNVAQTYSLEHKGEIDLFNHLFKLLNSNVQKNESFARDLASGTGVLQTSISQHMSKEEEQVFPLLIEKFSVEEQASLVWQFLCSIPVNTMKKFLPWLSFSTSADEYQQMCKCLRKVIPKEKLLQQVIFSWIKLKESTNTIEGHDVGPQNQHSLYSHDGKVNHQHSGKHKCIRAHSRTVKIRYTVSVNDASDLDSGHLINEILYLHKAINQELEDIADEARKIERSGDFSDLTSFYERLQFIAEVCIFHSVVEDKVIIPAVEGGVSFFEEHAEEKSQFNELRCLIENIQNSAPPTDAALVTLYSGWACKGHHHGVCLSSNVAGRCLVKQYTNRVVEENCVRVSCPYALHLQNADEQAVKRNLQISTANEIMSGGAVGQNSLNTAGNELSCCVPGLGVNSYNLGMNSTSKCFHPLSFSSSAPSLSPSIFIWETNNGSRGIDHEVHPMDTIFKFHKAILKDLEYLDVESGKLSYCDEPIFLQFMGRFQLLWSLYRAHSNAEDEIVFPALESLHNVSHSYTLDHKQEEELFEDISRALCDLSELHEHMKGDAKVQNLNLTPLDDADYGEDCRRNYNELAAKLQGMCKSIRSACISIYIGKNLSSGLCLTNIFLWRSRTK